MTLTHMYARLINFSHRRIILNRLLRSAGMGLALASACGLLMVVIDRWFSLNLTLMLYGLQFGAIVVIVLAVSALGTPPKRSTALQIDRTLRLHDQFSSAHELSGSFHPSRFDAGFADLLAHQADALASRISVRTVAPLRLTFHWAPALLLFALLATAYIYLPARPQSPANRGSQSALSSNDRLSERDKSVADQLNSLLSSAAASQPASASQPDAASAQGLDSHDLKMLQDLAAQLSGKSVPTSATSPNDQESSALAETPSDHPSAALNSVADKLENQSKFNAQTHDALNQEFSNLNPPKALPSTREFVKSLKDGDLNTAASAIEQLIQQSKSLPEADRKKLARDLRDLADELRSRAHSREVGSEERDEQIRQTFKDMNLPADDVLDPDQSRSKEETLEELRNRLPGSPETARKLADEIEKRRQERAIDEQTSRDMQNLADSLDDSTEDLESPQSSPATEPESATPPPATSPSSEHSQQADRSPPSSQPAQAESQPEGAEQERQSPQQQSQPETRSAQPPVSRSEEQSQVESHQDQPSNSAQSQPDQQAQPTSAQSQSESRNTQSSSSSQPALNSDNQSAQPNSSQTQPSPSPATTSPSPAEPSQPRSPQSATPPAQQNPTTPSSDQQRSPQSRSADQSQQSAAATQPSASRQPASQTNSSAARQSSSTTSQNSPTTRQSQSASTQSSENRKTGESARAVPQQTAQPRPGTAQDSKPEPQSASDILRRLAQREQQSRDQQSTSQKLRDLAQKLSDNMSPEEKQKWAQQWQREHGNSLPIQNSRNSQPSRLNSHPSRQEASNPQAHAPNSEPSPKASTEGGSDDTRIIPKSGTDETPEGDSLDLRGDENPDSTIFRWLDDETPDAAEPADTAASPITVEQARHAVDEAERAVTQSSAPPRYHSLIKRFFGRVSRSLPNASSTPSPNKSALTAPPATQP
ncbi:MAG TPA: hypothetical protein VG711_02325 [Phycisphaerales bacterium]|nr:hypothetical protein [Phycisphaerales bacterium]